MPTDRQRLHDVLPVPLKAMGFEGERPLTSRSELEQVLPVLLFQLLQLFGVGPNACSRICAEPAGHLLQVAVLAPGEAEPLRLQPDLDRLDEPLIDGIHAHFHQSRSGILSHRSGWPMIDRSSVGRSPALAKQ